MTKELFKEIQDRVNLIIADERFITLEAVEIEADYITIKTDTKIERADFAILLLKYFNPTQLFFDNVYSNVYKKDKYGDNTDKIESRVYRHKAISWFFTSIK